MLKHWPTPPIGSAFPKLFVQRFSSLLPRVDPTYRTGPVGISALAEESKRIGDAPGILKPPLWALRST